MKRKVQYVVWIPALPIDKTKKALDGGAYADATRTKVNYPNLKEGTHCFSEPSTGIFHSWGVETVELAEDVVSNTIAIVEDCVTGYVHKVDPCRMRFMLPEEKSSTEDNETALSDHTSERDALLAIHQQLKFIAKKLDVL